MNKTTKAHLALLGTNIFFAINFSAAKQLMGSGMMKPFALNLVRVLFTVALLWVLFLGKPKKEWMRKKDIGRFILCGLTGIAINQLLFLKGLSLTLSIHASLLMLTTPILITVIAAWLLKEKLTTSKLAGLALGLSGALVLVLARDSTGNANDVLLGDILIIINAMSYAFYFILVKPLMHEYDPLAVLRIIFTIGLFFMLPFCWSEFMHIGWKELGWKEFINLFLVVFCGTFLAYLFNVYGIKILGAHLAGTYIYSQPLFAAVIAMIFMGESLSLYKIVAGLLIIAGVYLSKKSFSSD